MAFVPAPETVGEILASMPELSTFNQLVRRSGLIVTLDRPGPYTVFAPSNDAFDALPEHTIGRFVNDEPHLRQVMQYHAAEGLFPAVELAHESSVLTLLGEPLGMLDVGPDLVVDGSARIVQADIQAENGIVQVIDTVLVPF